MLGFVPEGIQRLTGVNPGDWIDRWADARDALPAQWHNFLSEILELADDDLRIARIESLLVPLWRETRSTSDTLRTRVTDWCEHAAMRAATSGTGRSVRQAERRFKQWMGLSQRELRVMGRSERAFFHALALEASAGHIDWADVATAIGYSDQSHMIRETRRITGFAPTTLRERIRTEPSFWLYRLWGAWG